MEPTSGHTYQKFRIINEALHEETNHGTEPDTGGLPCADTGNGPPHAEELDDGTESDAESIQDGPDKDGDEAIVDVEEFEGVDISTPELGNNAATDATSRDQNRIDATLPEGKLREAPTLDLAKETLKDLESKLNPPRKKGNGHVDPKINPFVRIRMEGMRTLLNFFTNPKSATYQKWCASSMQASISLGRGTYCARQLRKLTRQFIENRKILPINPYGDWNQTMLADEDLPSDINLHLQELGKDITAGKIVEFLAHPEVKLKHGITKKISLRTAERYLKLLGFRWITPKKGQYADGHEREDVVWYRDNRFLPKMKDLLRCEKIWSTENLPEEGPQLGRRVIKWHHDEVIFYAHDWGGRRWFHKDATPKPYKKGEGCSLMVADLVSVDFGWLQSPNGKESARVHQEKKIFLQKCQ
ncbi:uncharacterized protein LACBIDRAFT_326022 [Laccaria bicolor S238N-H82]|uniref:Predicted protein n=1 Tax=Laccaria bicolor (strain S238N-H82 / ATCC MYA-4686) TaxID=486041 RepID=B0D720_LACBS|nr:uncharacterized protein LACBIDRAFT_326022 [Laccaria bicolor S238N-H82]EDR09574.1 predicted protein [Laccaria bicolor S238N-H82]|eukprot:XP_001879923.1 predicted protein [Laccaria bicolor S238N-H82]